MAVIASVAALTPTIPAGPSAQAIRNGPVISQPRARWPGRGRTRVADDGLEFQARARPPRDVSVVFGDVTQGQSLDHMVELAVADVVKGGVN